ncbi:MAG: serine/threonine protein kinase [Planctomycetaceae bacterium]|nr:serine/threonine protein kinase [Planctomycetaceae bacterium]
MSDFDAASTAKDRSTSASCPSQESLLDFLNDRLPENEVDHVVQHVEHCAKCQRSLDVLGEKTGIHNRLPNIEGFRIEAELGRGGMGSVYLAQRVEDDQVVAIKVLPEEYLNDQERRQRFSREIETLSRLSHPNIVQVLQACFSQQQPYFVMEYLSGLTLGQFTRSLPLAPKVATEIIRLVATAVQFAHEHQVVHRDLKPSNIILTPCSTGTIRVGGGDGPERCYDIRLLDFSLAKEVDQTTLLTRTGEILGTLGYMAPEQVLGGEVGPAADIYACGILLYELLSGRTPHQAANLPELIHQIRHAEPISLRALVPTIPKDLETICEKCLEKEPGKRYATAAELAADLEACGRARKITARPVSAIRKLVRWAYRRPATTTAIASATILLLSGLATTGWMLRQSQLSFRELQAEQQRTLANKNIAENLTADLLSVMNDRGSITDQLEILLRHTPQIEADVTAKATPENLRNAYQINSQIVFCYQRLCAEVPVDPKDVSEYYNRAIEYLERFSQVDDKKRSSLPCDLVRTDIEMNYANICAEFPDFSKASDLFGKAEKHLSRLSVEVLSPEQQYQFRMMTYLLNTLKLRNEIRPWRDGLTSKVPDESYSKLLENLRTLNRQFAEVKPSDRSLYLNYSEDLCLCAGDILNSQDKEPARAMLRAWLDAPDCWDYTGDRLLLFMGELCEASKDPRDIALLGECLRRNLQSDHRANPKIQKSLNSELFDRLMAIPELKSAITASRNPKPKAIPTIKF